VLFKHCAKLLYEIIVFIIIFLFFFTEDKKGLYEAPIPGYMGFVPRINPTQIGLGQRYKNRTQLGLNDFANYQERKFGHHSATMPSEGNRIPSRGGPATVENNEMVGPGPITLRR
jgi:hypothetical protein